MNLRDFKAVISVAGRDIDVEHTSAGEGTTHLTGLTVDQAMALIYLLENNSKPEKLEAPQAAPTVVVRKPRAAKAAAPAPVEAAAPQEQEQPEPEPAPAPRVAVAPPARPKLSAVAPIKAVPEPTPAPEDEDEFAPLAASDDAAGLLPEELRKTDKLRDVLTWAFENGARTTADIVAKCKEVTPHIPLLARVSNLEDRVKRAVIVLGLQVEA